MPSVLVDPPGGQDHGEAEELTPLSGFEPDRVGVRTDPWSHGSADNHPTHHCSIRVWCL